MKVYVLLEETLRTLAYEVWGLRFKLDLGFRVFFGVRVSVRVRV